MTSSEAPAGDGAQVGGLIERGEGPKRALVYLPILPDDGRGQSLRFPEQRLEEACRLTEAIDLLVVDAGVVNVRTPRPATLVGQGIASVWKAKVTEHAPEVVIIDAPLSPIQQRNLERELNAKVLDRTGLILEIFSARARSREGRLQVELAHLSYQRSRLVRTWTHLERQRGGFGFLGGPGETQIEADRRMIRDRIAVIEKQLETVRRTRSLHRAERKKNGVPVVALVGYTNAGKSTLFNRLSRADVLAKDMLFATLDPTLRRVKLASGTSFVLSDTVGFIADLPTQLISAFHATLEEVIEADVILHVRDISSATYRAEAEDVDHVLAELGISPEETPIIEVWNKIDRLEPRRRRATALKAREAKAVAISSLTGQGLDELLGAIEEALTHDHIDADVELRPEEGAELAWLYAHGRILRSSADPETGVSSVRVRLGKAEHGTFMKRLARPAPSDDLAAE